jgi:hypothetical protein
MDGKVYLWEALLFITLYIIYVGTVIIGRVLFQRWKATNNARMGSRTNYYTFIGLTPLAT